MARKLPIRPVAAALAILGTAGLMSALAGESEPQPYEVAKAEEGTMPSPAPYALGAGDKVRITVFGETDLSGTFEVAGDRTVAMPLIGEVQAAGLTVRELEASIEARLRDGYLKAPKVSAEVVNYRPFFIIGEVSRPGGYPYVDSINVNSAVALGGGFTYRARTGTAFLTRAADPARKEQPVTPDTVIMPGDVVRIPERYF